MGNTCDNCKRSFADEYELNKHTRTCIVNTYINKEKDDNDDNDNDDNDDNINESIIPSSSFKNPSTDRRCLMCYQFKDISSFHKGKYRCKTCLSKKVNCPECNTTLNHNTINRHVREVHQEKVNVKCLKCDKTYNKRYFINHKCILKSYEVCK